MAGGTVTLGSLNLNNSDTYITMGVDAPTPRPGEPVRTVALNLSVSGSSADDVVANLRAIENELNKAEQAWDAARIQQFVTCDLAFSGSSTPVSFTVRRGWLDYFTGAFDKGFANRAGLPDAPVQLTLECEPLGIGAGTTYAGGTITGGTTGWTWHIDSLPGDAPGYGVLTLTDVSGSSKVINKWVIGHRSLADLDEGDFDGWYDLTLLSGGTAGASTDAIGNDYVSTGLTSFWEWKNVAYASAPSPVTDNSGLFHIYLRCMDTAIAAPPVRNVRLTSKGVSGSMPAGNYVVVVVAGVTNVADGQASEPIYFSLGGETFGNTTDEVTIGWDPPLGGFTSSRTLVYFKRDTEDWKFFNAGSSTSYNLDTESAAGTANPPGAAYPPPAKFRYRTGLESGNAMGEWSAPVDVMLSNSQWEMVYLGTAQLPPVPVEEGGTIEPWRIEIQAQNAATATRTVRVDAIALVPAMWDTVEATYEGLDLSTQRAWVLGTDRTGRNTAKLVNKVNGDEEGQVSMLGELKLGPGDTTIVFIPSVEDGVSDVANVKFTASLEYFPVYRSLGSE